jgi:integrase
MARFRKTATPERQALSVAKQLHRTGAVVSVRTLANYQERLEQVAKNMQRYGFTGEIRHLSPDNAIQYLEIRGQEVGQKTLDMERQALQAMMQITGILAEKATLRVVKSEQAQVLASRAYTKAQVERIANAQRAPHALATELAHAAGLRAHELHTLLPAHERPADARPTLESKWLNREGVHYTVQGKGGLVREVLIPHKLAERLESTRLSIPDRITDRKVHYIRHYDIGAGKKWSDSFSRAASRALGWSEGAHGVRHSYAQERMHELQHQGMTRSLALETVSQEMGHFRPEITETYLR